MRLARSLALVALLLAVGAATLPATAQNDDSPFLLFEDLHIGMEGIGKTTIGGGDIRIFQTRIVGIVDNPGELNDFVLVRSSGDLIAQTGGYAQGMSGSPIYINDKLIGAFFAAYLFDQSPNPIGLVRPIETMMQLNSRIETQAEEAMATSSLINNAEENVLTVFENVNFEDGSVKTIELVENAPSLATREANPDTLYAVKTSSPLWVNGLSGRSLEWLSKGLSSDVLENFGSTFADFEPAMGMNFGELIELGVERRYNTMVLPMAATSTSAQVGNFADEFVPGGSMGALLTTGDVSFGGVCTTSYVDYDADILLACGHQIFLTGESSLFLTQANVIDVVNSAQISFVLAEVNTQESAGTIFEDRIQAIGGSLGVHQESARMTARAHDMTTDVTRDITVNMAPTTNLTASLVFASLLQLVDDVLNRVGRGTMKIDYTIRGDGMSQRISRSDVFVSFNDIALAGPLQAAQLVFLIDQNEFIDPKIDRIDVDITTTDEVRWYEVTDIETDKEVYHPGDEVRYIIVMNSFRGEERREAGSFIIPDDTTVRRLTLHSFGGPRRTSSGSSAAQPITFDNLDELLGALEQITGNDQLTIELLGLPVDPDDDSSVETTKVQHLGDWVVTGDDRVNIQIEPRPEPVQEIEEPLEEPEDNSTQTPDEENSRDDDSSEGNDEEETSESEETESEESEESSEEGSDEDCEQLFYC